MAIIGTTVGNVTIPASGSVPINIGPTGNAIVAAAIGNEFYFGSYGSLTATGAGSGNNSFTSIGQDISTAPAPLSLAQKNFANSDSNTTVSAIYTSAQTAGSTNLAVVFYDAANLSIVSVSDSQNGLYRSAIGPDSIGNVGQEIFYVPNIVAAAASANTVLLNCSGSASYLEIRIYEIAGADTTSPIDATNTANGTTPDASISITTVAANTLILSAISYGLVGPGLAGVGFDLAQFTSFEDQDDYKIVSSLGTYTDQQPSDSGQNWLGQIVSIKAGGILIPSGTLVYSTNPVTSWIESVPATLWYRINPTGAWIFYDGTNYNLTTPLPAPVTTGYPDFASANAAYQNYAVSILATLLNWKPALASLNLPLDGSELLVALNSGGFAIGQFSATASTLTVTGAVIPWANVLAWSAVI